MYVAAASSRNPTLDNALTRLQRCISLDIRQPSRVQFYKGYMFNRIPELVSELGILLSIFDEISVLIKEDSSFKKELMMTPFVLTNTGSLQEPQRYILNTFPLYIIQF